MASTDTPLMKQYLEVKSRYSDCLLFFRMGDFYEMFFEDAKVASRALEIALTARNKTETDPVPMCGVPHHAAAGYVNRLVSQGFKVAICEQLEDPASTKGIVKRDVVRVVSPGTRLDAESLDSKAPNFTHAAQSVRSGKSSHVHWATCDFTTGVFYFGICTSVEQWLDIARAQSPAELLFRDDAASEELFLKWKDLSPKTLAQKVPEFYFDLGYATERLQEQFQVTHAQAVHPLLASSPGPAGALIKYFQETQKAPRIPAALKMTLWGQNNAMELDASTVHALELLPERSVLRDCSLLSWMDRTKTAMGGRLLRDWLLHPLTSVTAIEDRQKEVLALRSCYQTLATSLNEVYDLERLLSRISLGTGALANARDLNALAVSLLKAEEIARIADELGATQIASKIQATLVPNVLALGQELAGALVAEIPLGTRDGGIFKRGYRAELDELIALSENGQQWLADFEARERQATKISSLKVRFNRVFGYYIEITKANLGSAPAHYIRKQTMVGGERYITEELKSFEDKILNAERRRSDYEYALFKEFCMRAGSFAAEIAAIAQVLAHVDVIQAFANLSDEDGYTLPVLNESTDCTIVEGKHPTVSVAMQRSDRGARFISNSVTLAVPKPFLMITGPNMGGKSTIMRQTALITLMAQMGSFVPAEHAMIGIADRIFTRIGASDNLSEGASTFMVEMNEMSFILRHATKRSLILIDEIGRGTSTYDGLSLAWALAFDIATRIGARTMFATHYHELTQLAAQTPSIQNAKVAVEVLSNTDNEAAGATVRFLYRLEPGVAERSYGILVARLAGLPEDILGIAENMLEQLEVQGKKARTPATRTQMKLNLETSVRRAKFTHSEEVSAQLTTLT